jgi:hypothetical protein
MYICYDRIFIIQGYHSRPTLIFQKYEIASEAVGIRKVTTLCAREVQKAEKFSEKNYKNLILINIFFKM